MYVVAPKAELALKVFLPDAVVTPLAAGPKAELEGLEHYHEDK